MATEVKTMFRVRKVGEAVDAEMQGSEERPGLTQQLEVLVAPGASPYGEVVRPGRAYFTNTTTAIAAVVAIPTTAVMFALYNNEPDGGRSYIIDWVAASGVAKTAAAGQAQLLGLVGQVREAVPADGGLVIKKLNGMVGNDTSARTILNATALPATTGLQTNWMPLGPAVGFPGAAATPGHGLYFNVDGRIICPPGRYFAMHVLADVVGSTFQGFIAWHEKQLTLD
jgi:hypothetical protein